MRVSLIILMVFVAAVSAAFGMAVERWRIWPYPMIRAVKRVFVEEPAPQATASVVDMSTEGAEIVVLGDSIMVGGHWEEQLWPCRVANRAVSGSRVDHVEHRLAATLAPSVRAYILMAGINDVIQGGSPETTLDAYRKVLERLADTGAAVYVFSILPVNRADWTAAARALNNGVKSIADDTGARVIDLQEAFSAGPYIKPELTSDGVHLSAAGYRLLWTSLEDKLADQCSVAFGEIRSN